MVDIREIEHEGHRGVELLDGLGARMVVLSSIGPRIAWFGRAERDNLLYWDAAGEHRRGAWRLYGGHRLWVTRPLADESEEIYDPDNAPSRVEELEDGVRITSPPSALALERTLTIRAQGGAWTVEHRLRNVGDLLWSGGAWALTCTRPSEDTVYRIPLGGGPPGWDVTTIVIPTRWGGGHTSRLDDPQITMTADAMEIRARDDEAKRMVLAPRGRLEMRDPARGVFCKHAAYEPDGAYPLGTNLAVYVGPRRFMVELETMSPLRTLPPGA
ncbi:MAG TPA: hypothetical protein VNO30_09910, partial [Kofleriaceae bacterium]|nr:hypothetical protein [Kofleriaceae bacterium]